MKQNYCPSYTDLCSCRVIWLSISKKNDNVRYIAAVTCRWSQHAGTDVGKRSSRVAAASLVSEWWDGWLNCSDWWMCVQVKTQSDLCREGDKTHACVTAVNLQPLDKAWYERLHQAKIRCIDIYRVVQHEHYVDGTVDRLRYEKNNDTFLFI